MKTEGDQERLDHIFDLYLASVEANEDSLSQLIARFPSYEEELREFAALVKIDEILPDRDYTDQEEQLLNSRTISIVQNALYNSRRSHSVPIKKKVAAPGVKIKAASAGSRRNANTLKRAGQAKTFVSRDLSRRHIARAVLSAEIVSRLWKERTFGRVKHQKVLHLCEYVGQLTEIKGDYRRRAAGPLDNKLIYSVEAELKKQNWFETYELKSPSGRCVGHGYRPLANAGGHCVYFDRWWTQQTETIVNLIELMRPWNTQRCEILSTVYAAWNDLIIWAKPVTDESILTEILENWHEGKRSIPEHRWRSEIDWIRRQNLVPTGFGQATAAYHSSF
jgi:hypothetical protein